MLEYSYFPLAEDISDYGTLGLTFSINSPANAKYESDSIAGKYLHLQNAYAACLQGAAFCQKLAANDFTISFWLIGNNGLCISPVGTTNIADYKLLIRATEVRLTNSNGAVYRLYPSISIDTTQQWGQFTCVRKNNVLYAFWNGVLLNSIPVSGAIARANYIYISYDPYHGKISDTKYKDMYFIIGKGLWTQSFTPSFGFPLNKKIYVDNNGTAWGKI